MTLSTSFIEPYVNIVPGWLKRGWGLQIVSCPVPAPQQSLDQNLGTAGDHSWKALLLLDSKHLVQSGFCLTIILVLFLFSYVISLLLSPPPQLHYRHELSYTVYAARPRRQGHIYAAQISTGQRIRFDMRYLKYRGGDPLLSLLLSLAAPRPLWW